MGDWHYFGPTFPYVFVLNNLGEMVSIMIILNAWGAREVCPKIVVLPLFGVVFITLGLRLIGRVRIPTIMIWLIGGIAPSFLVFILPPIWMVWVVSCVLLLKCLGLLSGWALDKVNTSTGELVCWCAWLRVRKKIIRVWLRGHAISKLFAIGSQCITHAYEIGIWSKIYLQERRMVDETQHMQAINN